jgi:hypothetical protein
MTAGEGDDPQSGENSDDAARSRPLIAISLLAFFAVLGLGVGLGVLATGSSITGGRVATAQLPTLEPEETITSPEPAVEVAGATIEAVVTTTVPPTTVPPTTVPPTTVPPTTVPPTTVPPTTVPATTGDDRGGEVEFIVLPKAVYDRLELDVGDVVVHTIASNDKIGGVLESVQLTGLGVLAPGFTLDELGTLSGTAVECGNWRVQYELASTNPATGTSWIDITVGGCANSS